MKGFTSQLSLTTLEWMPDIILSLVADIKSYNNRGVAHGGPELGSRSPDIQAQVDQKVVLLVYLIISLLQIHGTTPRFWSTQNEILFWFQGILVESRTIPRTQPDCVAGGVVSRRRS